MRPFLALLLVLIGFMALFQCQTPSQASEPVKQTDKPAPLDSAQLQQKLTLLLKHDVLLPHIRIDSRGIALFPNVAAREADSAEVQIFPDEYETTARLFTLLSPDSMVRYLHKKGTKPWGAEWKALGKKAPPAVPPSNGPSEKPLAGWRIALDPGHIAGDLATAEIEGKYVKIRPSRATNYDRIAFWEANLTLATAFLIRHQLDSLGATVMMTRKIPGLSTKGESYWKWKENNWPQIVKDSAESWELTPYQLKHWLTRADEKSIFRTFFNADDLKNRAKMINRFRPHLSLIIHYNIHGPNWENRDREGFYPMSDTNYLMAFVPGSFMEGELRLFDDRIALLRQLLTDDVSNSVRASDAFARASNQYTGVAITPVKNTLSYLNNSSIYAGYPGVYARNLSLTRMIRGAMIYGESLNQDYTKEAMQLGKKDLTIEGIAVSRRVKDVADAYVAAVLEYAQGE